MKRISKKRLGAALAEGNRILQERQRAARIPAPDSNFLVNSTKGPLTGTDWAVSIIFFLVLPIVIGTIEYLL
jgi:hypothetical protein